MNEITTKPEEGMPTVGISPIGSEQIKKFNEILQKYKNARRRTEERIKASEQWWKLRNTSEEQKETNIGADGSFTSKSGWLHNVIVSKHADAMEAFPEPLIRPREESDKAEAQMLSAIIPCILEQNRFEDTYDDVMWQKAKSGTGAYKVIWDSTKLNGLGDIAVERVNLLNVYIEPGITDLQKSRYLFHTELWDTDILEERFPITKGKLKGNSFLTSEFSLDDNISTADKNTVIEVYYHKYVGPVKTLQYCKYVGDIVLYATENIPEFAGRGLYDHGKYPYVFDPLFPIEGSVYGYGYMDLCKNPQTQIDLLDTCFIKNAMVGAIPRYFKRPGGNIKEEDFLDLSRPFVETADLSETTMRRIDHTSLDGNYISLLDRKIQELRETSGNTETSTGSAPAAMPAAGIAALQEASGKGSRDATKGSYRAFSSIVEFCIELMRQFYTTPRKFRIVGELGAEEFVTYKNTGLQMQDDSRLPIFDIKVSAQKKNVYTRNAQNELVLQLYNLGFFSPQNTDQALLCIGLMDFEGKDEIMQKISQHGTMYQKLLQYMKLALAFAQKARPDMVQGLHDDIMATLGASGAKMGGVSVKLPESEEEEHAVVEKARARSRTASQPEGGGAR